MHVAFCHPLSHLKRRTIKADPTHLRTDNTFRVEIRLKFPPWNGRRGILKTVGRGLKRKGKRANKNRGGGSGDGSFEPQITEREIDSLSKLPP